jgi:hypothetical protein
MCFLIIEVKSDKTRNSFQCEIKTIESESLALVCEPHTGGDLVPVEVTSTGTIILNCGNKITAERGRYE